MLSISWWCDHIGLWCCGSNCGGGGHGHNAPEISPEGYAICIFLIVILSLWAWPRQTK